MIWIWKWQPSAVDVVKSHERLDQVQRQAARCWIRLDISPVGTVGQQDSHAAVRLPPRPL